MAMPPPYSAAIPPFGLPPGPAATQPPRTGQLFTAALFTAGRDGCTCKSCAYLVKVRDLMMETAEAALNARASDNPEP